MRGSTGIALAMFTLVGPGGPALAAQSEVALKDFFEGRTVVVKLDMPGSENGVDVWPGVQPPLDFSRYGNRIKQFGTAITAGRSVLITKVHLKERHIEFQLAGGGYGTFGDNTSTSVYTPSAEKTAREKNLERELGTTTDQTRKKAIREELDNLRKDRDRENARLRAMTAPAEQQAAENLRQRRLAGGSRFNLRYRLPLRPDEVTPETIMTALAEYVDFSALRGAATEAPPARPVVGVAGLRKGLALDEVAVMLGAPDSSSERMEGTLRAVRAVYLTAQHRIEALFVEGVLVRYAIASR